MDRIKSKYRCPSCGRLVYSQGHSPDCKELVEEVETKENAVENVIETPSEENGDVSIEQIVSEREVVEEILIAFEGVLPENRLLDGKREEKGDESIPEVEKVDTDSEELGSNLISMIEELETTSAIIDDLNENIIPERIEELELLEIESETDLRKIITRVLVPITKLVESVEHGSATLVEAKKEIALYKDKYLEENGFTSENQLKNAVDERMNEYYEIDGSFVARVFKRGEIKSKREKYESTCSVLDQYNDYDRRLSSAASEYQYLHGVERLVISAWNKSSEKIMQRFDQHVGIDSTKIEESYSYDVMNDEGEQEEGFDEATLKKLQEEYIQGIVIPNIRKAEQDWDEEFSEEEIEKGLEILRDSFGLDFNSRSFWGQDDEVESRKTCLDGLQRIRPHSLSGVLMECIRKTSEGSMSDRLQNIGSIVHDTIPRHEETTTISKQYLKIFEAIESISSTKDIGYIKGLWERKHFMERSNSNDEEKLEKFISELDMQLWEMISESELFEEAVGSENLEFAKEYVRREIFGKLLKMGQGSDESVKMGFKILSFKSPEAIVVNILNAFRETGRNVHRPFLGAGYYDSVDTELFKYLESLSEEQLQGVFDLGITEIGEIVDITRENPDDFFIETLYDKETGKSSDNPVYKEIQEKVFAAGIKFMELGGEDRKSFAITLAGSLKCDLGEFRPIIEEALTNSNEMSAQSAALDTILRRMEDDSSMIKVYLDNLDSIGEIEDVQAMERREKNFWVDANNHGTAYNLIMMHAEGWKNLIEMVGEIDDKDSKYLKKLISLGYEVFINEVERKRKSEEESEEKDSKSGEEFQKVMLKIVEITRGTQSENAGFLLSNAVCEHLVQSPENMDRIILIAESGMLVNEGMNYVCLNSLESLMNMSDGEINILGKKISANEECFNDYAVAGAVIEYPESIDTIIYLHDNGLFKEDSLKYYYINNIRQIIQIPKEKIMDYIEVMRKIDKSPSQEIQRLKNQLLVQILDADDPDQAYSAIEEIFVSNNIPTVGKIYKIFEELHPRESLGRIVESNSGISPFLRDAGPTRRNFTIYTDLLKCHIDSGNRSLKQYLEILQSGEVVMSTIAENGIENLEGSDLDQAKFFLAKLRTLMNNTRSGKTGSIENGKPSDEIDEEYEQLSTSLQVREGQTVNDRIIEMFLKPLGFKTIDEVLERMKDVKRRSHDRGIALVQQAQDGKLDFQDGDLLKGIDDKFLNLIMQNGNVAKEFLGASSGSDATPFDTDVSRVREGEAVEGFDSVLKASIARNFGQMIFVVRDRDQFQETDSDTKDFDSEKMELFETGVLGGEGQHFGIRTGFPMTEVDFIVIQEGLEGRSDEMEKIYFEIAKNGYYIPIADCDGKIIFTPEMFDEYFEMFEGLEMFDGPDLDIVRTEQGDRNFDQVQELVEIKNKDKVKITEISIKIRQVISDVLSEYNIELKSEFDTGLLGAELHDTGSTGRHTNAPKDYDFDLALRLDDAELDKATEILEKIKMKLQPERIEEYSKESGHQQLRAFNCKGISNEPVDVDVGIVKKSELAVFGSHDAVNAKLEWIRENHGEDIYEQVVANIVLAKQILKEGEAYKKMDHGGMGGIGVENWILLHGGNVMEAFRTFYDAAHGDEGNVLSLEEFRERYRIMDPGVNVQKLRHDNFVHVLKNSGYMSMVKVIDKYLSLENE